MGAADYAVVDPATGETGKRRAHTLMPVMVRRGERLLGVLGTMGGRAPAQIHVQVLLRLLAGTPAQVAVSAPRWVVGSIDLGEPDDTVRVEAGIEAAARESLARATDQRAPAARRAARPRASDLDRLRRRVRRGHRPACGRIRGGGLT